MGALDQRSRSVHDVVPVDARRFIAVTIPEAIERNGALAVDAMRSTGLESITIAVDGTEMTWRVVDDQLVVTPSDDGRARADLDAETFSAIVTDTRSAIAVMISGESVMTRGRITHLIDWEIALRALLDGRQPHRTGSVSMCDRDGGALDLTRRFTLDDDPDEIRHFVSEAGFALFTGVVDVVDLQVLDEALTSRRASARREDPTTWWARTSTSDEEICVRFNDLDDHTLPVSLRRRTEPVVAALGAGHVFEHIDVLLKPIGVVEGISDLPWHKDCALGFHTYQCAQVVCGVSITASGAHNGQLGVVAGSHRVNLPQFAIDDTLDLPVVWIETEPGDVTVHLSCTLHTSTPPLVDERRVAYVTWCLPGGSESLDAVKRAVRDRAGRDTYSPDDRT